MKKNYFIKLLSAVVSVVMLCGVFSPARVSAASNNTYAGGLQKFLDDGNHTQLVDCPDAVYMEYAELLRTDDVAVHTMHLLGLIYGGLFHNDKIEPDKDLYKQALLNIIRTYEEENAEITAQRNLQTDTKELKDHLHDVVDGELDWFEAIGASEWLDKKLVPAASMALSVVNEMLKDEDDLVKGISTLKTTLQNYEKYDAFLQLVAAKAEGELQLAAAELRAGLSEVMKVRLLAYADLVKDSAEDYAKLFVSGLFTEGFRDALEETFALHIGKIYIGETSYLQAFQAAKLGVDIGKLSGNILVRAEDVLAYIIEIKAVHDISVILENEMNIIKDNLQKDSSKVTEADVQNYITYGNYLISSRIRGQYCMTAIYLNPGLLPLFSKEDAKNAEALYNRLTNNLLGIKKKLDAIMNGDASVTSPIVDAVNYEKDVITDPSLEGVWDPQGIKHQIRIPKISLNTPSAQMFNQKIYNNHCGGYELLLSNQEANKIFDCTYEYKVYNGVAAIAVLNGGAVQAGGGWLSYKVYYYSLDEDRELTFDEYLDAVGITYDTVLSRIMDTDAYKEAMQHAWEPITNMTDCLLDEESTSAFFENIATMDGWSQIKTSSVLNSENDTSAFSLMLNGIEADSIKYYNCSKLISYAVVENNGKYGLIDYLGKIILPIEYESIEPRETSPSGQEVKLYAYDSNYQGYWIEQDGSLTSGFLGGWGFEGGAEIFWNHEPVMFDYSEGKVPYSYEAYTSYHHGSNVLGTITKGTADVIPVQEINGWSQTTSNGMTTYTVKKVSEKYALLNLKTKELITDFIFDDYGHSGFVEGILAVSKEDKWGYVNQKGQMITEFIYDTSEVTPWGNKHMYSALNNYVIVRQGDLWGLIDTQGNTVVKVTYDGISQVNPDGMFWLKEDGTWSLYQLEK